MLILFLCWLLHATALTHGCSPLSPRSEIACYFEGHLKAASIDPCKCTLLIVRGSTINNHHSVQPLIDFKSISELKEKNPQLKIIFSVGGENVKPESFTSVTSSSEAITNFTESITSLVHTENLDGVELDWRWPGMPGAFKGKEDVTTLAKIVRISLDQQLHSITRRDVATEENETSADPSETKNLEIKNTEELSASKVPKEDFPSYGEVQKMMETSSEFPFELFYDRGEKVEGQDDQDGEEVVQAADKDERPADKDYQLEKKDSQQLTKGKKIIGGSAPRSGKPSVRRKGRGRLRGRRGKTEQQRKRKVARISRGKRKFKDYGNLDNVKQRFIRIKKPSLKSLSGWKVAPKQGRNPSLRVIRPLEKRVGDGKILMMTLSSKPEYLVKGYDLKALASIVDAFSLYSHNLTSPWVSANLEKTNETITTHNARLMGVSDMENADSLIDLLVSMGVPLSHILMGVPAKGALFQLEDDTQTTPRSPASGPPNWIPYKKMCSLLESGNWTLERDEDLTAPYAFKSSQWLAFDDPTSVKIKSKYALLRGLAGIAMHSIDSEDDSGQCGQGKYPLLASVFRTFTQLSRTPRKAVLQSLVRDLEPSGSSRSSTFARSSSDIRISPFRIVRVIDRNGAIRALRSNGDTRYECSRQGYYRDSDDCSQFYRCVKFDQYVDDYTVFEYSCPVGLVFDDRWEVCVWPSSSIPCDGSSEIFPIPKLKNTCINEGFFGDPENCRWFFACRDYYGDGNFTVYEFRCPFGLAYDEGLGICNWPWLVSSCGQVGGFDDRDSRGKAIIGSASLSQQPVQQEKDYKECIDCDDATLVVNGDGIYHSEKGIIVSPSYFEQLNKQDLHDTRIQNKIPGISSGGHYKEISGLNVHKESNLPKKLSPVPVSVPSSVNQNTGQYIQSSVLSSHKPTGKEQNAYGSGQNSHRQGSVSTSATGRGFSSDSHSNYGGSVSSFGNSQGGQSLFVHNPNTNIDSKRNKLPANIQDNRDYSSSHGEIDFHPSNKGLKISGKTVQSNYDDEAHDQKTSLNRHQYGKENGKQSQGSSGFNNGKHRQFSYQENSAGRYKTNQFESQQNIYESELSNNNPKEKQHSDSIDGREDTSKQTYSNQADSSFQGSAKSVPQSSDRGEYHSKTREKDKYSSKGIRKPFASTSPKFHSSLSERNHKIQDANKYSSKNNPKPTLNVEYDRPEGQIGHKSHSSADGPQGNRYNDQGSRTYSHDNTRSQLNNQGSYFNSNDKGISLASKENTHYRDEEIRSFTQSNTGSSNSNKFDKSISKDQSKKARFYSSHRGDEEISFRPILVRRPNSQTHNAQKSGQSYQPSHAEQGAHPKKLPTSFFTNQGKPNSYKPNAGSTFSSGTRGFSKAQTSTDTYNGHSSSFPKDSKNGFDASFDFQSNIHPQSNQKSTKQSSGSSNSHFGGNYNNNQGSSLSKPTQQYTSKSHSDKSSTIKKHQSSPSPGNPFASYSSSQSSSKQQHANNKGSSTSHFVPQSHTAPNNGDKDIGFGHSGKVGQVLNSNNGVSGDQSNSHKHNQYSSNEPATSGHSHYSTQTLNNQNRKNNYNKPGSEDDQRGYSQGANIQEKKNSFSHFQTERPIQHTPINNPNINKNNFKGEQNQGHEYSGKSNSNVANQGHQESSFFANRDHNYSQRQQNNKNSGSQQRYHSTTSTSNAHNTQYSQGDVNQGIRPNKFGPKHSSFDSSSKSSSSSHQGSYEGSSHFGLSNQNPSKTNKESQQPAFVSFTSSGQKNNQRYGTVRDGPQSYSQGKSYHSNTHGENTQSRHQSSGAAFGVQSNQQNSKIAEQYTGQANQPSVAPSEVSHFNNNQRNYGKDIENKNHNSANIDITNSHFSLNNNKYEHAQNHGGSSNGGSQRTYEKSTSSKITGFSNSAYQGHDSPNAYNKISQKSPYQGNANSANAGRFQGSQGSQSSDPSNRYRNSNQDHNRVRSQGYGTNSQHSQHSGTAHLGNSGKYDSKSSTFQGSHETQNSGLSHFGQLSQNTGFHKPNVNYKVSTHPGGSNYGDSSRGKVHHALSTGGAKIGSQQRPASFVSENSETNASKFASISGSQTPKNSQKFGVVSQGTEYKHKSDGSDRGSKPVSNQPVSSFPYNNDRYGKSSQQNLNQENNGINEYNKAPQQGLHHSNSHSKNSNKYNSNSARYEGSQNKDNFGGASVSDRTLQNTDSNVYNKNINQGLNSGGIGKQTPPHFSNPGYAKDRNNVLPVAPAGPQQGYKNHISNIHQPRINHNANGQYSSSQPSGKTLGKPSSNNNPFSSFLNNNQQSFVPRKQHKLRNRVNGGPSILSRFGNIPHVRTFGSSNLRDLDVSFGPEVCERAGLFRHPDSCDKFYECYWDRWLNRFTLHIFNCPVTIIYDSTITACNWPFNGPPCNDGRNSK